MNKVAVCSISSKNYFAFAKTLFDSIVEFHNDVDFVFLLADEITGELKKDEEPFTIIEAKDLGIKNFTQMSFSYDVIEFNVALKPFLIQHLFSMGYEKVIYFDADIMIFNRLDLIIQLLDSHSIIITPHITSPIPSGNDLNPQEVSFLKDGAYNLGFIAVVKNHEATQFLGWWAEKCTESCYREPETGLFVDQKWIDLVPSLFPSTFVLRHLGCNMAYWNLHERTIESGNLVNNSVPLIFFHFSGISLDNISQISKYQNRYNLETRKDIAPLFDLYKQRVMENQYEISKTWPYRYGKYDNGMSIGLLARRLYPSLSVKYSNPFQTDTASYYTLLKKKKILEKEAAININKSEIRYKITIINKLLKICMKLIGIDRYKALMKYMTYVAVLRRQKFLID